MKLWTQALEDILKEMSDAQAIKADVVSIMGLPTAGANGATILATDLQKCPNVYCQAGGLVLKALYAIFGGTSNRSEIKKGYDFKGERQYTYTSKLEDFGSSGALVDWQLN